jgi:hypothetical protein
MSRINWQIAQLAPLVPVRIKVTFGSVCLGHTVNVKVKHLERVTVDFQTILHIRETF